MRSISQVIKYLLTAGGSAVVDFCIFILITWSGGYYLYAQVVSRIAGGIFSFIVNRNWSFGGDVGRITMNARRWRLLYVCSYVLSLMFLYIAVEMGGIPKVPAKLVTDFLLMIFNFLIMRGYVYRDREGLTGLFRKTRKRLT